MNTKPRTFSFFNAGNPNILYIMAGCYNKLFSELGKPFMIVAITKNPEYYSTFFGKLKKIKLDNDMFLIISNWRRLPTIKLTHIRDGFYSVLSSTMNSAMNLVYEESYLTPKKYNHIFSLRSIIALSTNQRVAEILMDNRYAYMSSFSMYTNINKLLKEKFEPPYRTSLECWLIIRILTRLQLIFKSTHDGSILLTQPEFKSGIRIEESTGGNMKIPSLWGDYFLTEVNEVVDEAFIYVHTMKEPSNIFHENVSALKTIIDFQEQFNNLPENIKCGTICSIEEIDNYLKYNTKIGCCGALIYNSIRKNILREKPNFKKIVHSINDESVAELVSTKAVIYDIDRQLISEEKEKTKRKIEKQLAKIRKYVDDKVTDQEILNIKEYYIKSKSTYYNERKPRQKVFETLLTYLESDENIKSTVDIANQFIKDDDGKVIADICIKAQYGAKREFYVINIGAKAIARCTENFFKKNE